MKKTLKILISVLVIAILVALVYSVVTEIYHKEEIDKRLQTMPAFSFKTLKNKSFTNIHLKNNTPTVFIYFNSECGFCQYEVAEIKKNIESLRDIQFLFVSEEKPELIEKFLLKNKLEGCNNITFLYDREFGFTTVFDTMTIPTIVIYDKNKKLVKKVKGQVKANKLINLLGPVKVSL